MKKHIGKIFILAIAVIMLCSTLCSCGLVYLGVMGAALSEGEETSQSETTIVTPTKKATQKTEYYVGETYEVRNKGTLTFVSVEEYISDNMFVQPKENYKYIKLDFTAINTVSKENYFYWDFTCYADDTKCDRNYLADNDLYVGDNIGAGRKVSGSVIFEVPIEATHIEVEYAPDYNTIIKFIVQ